jgi:DNA polymerase I-like protein with 3'-5' exonuclease and polymerase domains
MPTTIIDYHQSNFSFNQFKEFLLSHYVIGCDTETTMTKSIVERELRLIQFGTEQEVWVFRWRMLSESEKQFIQEYLENPNRVKVIQNATFEYTIFRKYGILLKGIYDTKIMEQILYTGYDIKQKQYALDDIVYSYCNTVLDKSLQTSFDNVNDDYSIEQILYAANDIKYLLPIYRMQVDQLKSRDDEWIAALENENIRGYGEIEYHGMKLDTKQWISLIPEAQVIVQQAVSEMDSYLLEGGELYEKAVANKMVTTEDTLNFKWTSHTKVRILFKDLLGIDGTSKAFLKGYLKDHSDRFSADVQSHLQEYFIGNSKPLENFFIKNFRQYLIDNEFLIPKNTALVNWGSPPQRLKVFQFVHPNLKSTDRLELEKLKSPHSIIQSFQDYQSKEKLVSQFGESFIRDYVDSDGKVRTRLNPIVRTGRASSADPNMQQIPAKEAVGTKYRNCFICEPDEMYVDSDYSSQELVLIASLSQDPVWLNALQLGQDLHSVCAELVFKGKWADAAEADCAYYHQNKAKCKCKKHKPLRNAVKTINFGLAYGMSKYKLSATLSISEDEAQKLINEFFSVFPSIGACLKELGEFGVRYGYIMTPAPFFRKRYFPDWDKYKEFAIDHINGDYHWALGAIERQSKNTPIQGGAADMVKLALCFILWYLEDNNLFDIVKIVAVVHDQITTITKDYHADEWKHEFDKLMCDAAQIIVKDGTLKAETTVSPYWTK